MDVALWEPRDAYPHVNVRIAEINVPITIAHLPFLCFLQAVDTEKKRKAHGVVWK